MSFLSGTEFKVGAMVVVVGALIAFMSMQVSDDPSYLGRSRKAWFLMPDAGGLVKGSAIKTAGIPVGVIKNITLQDGMARVEITIKSDIPVSQSARIAIKSQGILGDKYIEIDPGKIADPPLPDDAQIITVLDKGSIDGVLAKVGDIATSLKDVADVLKESVSEDGTRKHVLGRIVNNIEKITADLAQVTSQNKDKITEVVDQVHGITKTLNELINDPSEDGFKKGWKQTTAAMNRLDKVMKNVEEITEKVNKGEGTIGKLINDETTVDNLNGAIEGVSGLLDTASKVTTAFDFHGEYQGDLGATKSFIGIQIQPGLDRYYQLAVIDDPAGVVEKTATKQTGTSTVDIAETKTYYSKTKFTALYAKNFWDYTLRGGMIESAGGVGLDYTFFRKKAKVSIEAFDFSKTNLKAYATYKFPYGFYLVGGYNDMMNKGGRAQAYAGAGLFMTNDDLKLLLTKSPF